MAISGHLVPLSKRNSHTKGELSAPKWPFNGSHAGGQTGYLWTLKMGFPGFLILGSVGGGRVATQGRESRFLLLWVFLPHCDMKFSPLDTGKSHSQRKTLQKGHFPFIAWESRITGGRKLGLTK